MLDTKAIFWDRMRQNWQQGIRLVAFALSGGGTAIFFLLLVLGGIFSYRYFLEWLPANFPIEILVALFLTWFLMRRAVLRTWLQRPDITFLLPAESSMQGYLLASAFYSLMVGLFQLLGLVLVLAPLYHQRWADQLSIWGWAFFLVVLFAWNLGMSWLETKSSTTLGIAQQIPTIFRAILNFWLITVSLWVPHTWWLLSLTVPAIYTIFAFQRAKETPFPWHRLVEEEAKKRSNYHRWAEIFVDLPYTPKRIAQRKRLVRLLNQLVPISKQTPHLFLFSRITLRDREIFSQYVLLSIWSLLLSWAIPILWIQYVIFLLGLFFWTETIRKIVQTDHLPLHYQLLPKQEREKANSLRKLYFSLSLLFASWLTVLFAITTLFTLFQSAIAWLVGLAFSLYVRQKARS